MDEKQRRKKAYRAWAGMKQRCQNKNNKGFHNYGGRGIRFCEHWGHSFSNFLADMGLPEEGQTLDRFPDNNGNYEPSNCRWATRKEQARNKRNNRLVTAFGQTKKLCEWADDPRCQVYLQLVHSRLRYGWTPERAIATPVGTFGRHHQESTEPPRMIDCCKETLIPLREAARRLERSYTQLWAWVTHGIRGVRLEAVRKGTLHTSEEAIQRFLNQTSPAPEAAPRTATEQRRATDAARKKLAEAGW